MITIVKDGNKMKCSQNTYDTMYKRLGYEILQETPKVEIKKEVHKEEPKEIKKEEIIKKTKEQKNTKNKNKKGE